jgi:hypothetical protein
MHLVNKGRKAAAEGVYKGRSKACRKHAALLMGVVAA